MKLLYNTYPTAFETVGGGEIQLLKYKEYIERTADISVDLFNQWAPNIDFYDIVHHFALMPGTVQFFLSVKAAGKPLLVSPNLWITQETLSDYDYEKIRLGFDIADFIVCNSHAECDTLASSLKLPRSKFLTIYNGIDGSFGVTVSEEIFRKKYKIHEKFVLNVANIEPRKNQLKLIKALKKYPKLKLVIIGSIRDKDYFERCKEVAGSQLIYIGRLDHESDLLRSAYSACECFALPSTVETPGLAALEACASQAKIIITQEGSTKEYFEDNAVYVEHSNIEDIANGIQLAIEASANDSPKRHVLKYFTWPSVLSDLESVYRQINSIVQLKNNSKSFYEYDSTPGNNIFVWSKEEVEFEINNCQLSFTWNALTKVRVDIFINGKLIKEDVHVDEKPESFCLNVYSATLDENKVRLVVKNIDLNKQPSSSRILGLCFRNVSIFKYEKNNMLSELVKNEILIENGGFHAVEFDGFNYNVWTKHVVEFEVYSQNLSWIWNTVLSCEVDVFIDESLVYESLTLGTTPVEFDHQISNGSDSSVVRLVVNNIVTPINLLDPRKLGVNLRMKQE